MIIIFLVLILCWLLFTPVELQVDTRVPIVSLQWVSIGKATAIYENDKWMLKFRVLFFNKQWELERLIFEKGKKRKTATRIAKQRKPGMKKLRKFLAAVKSFQVIKCQVAIDTDDGLKNAWLYPLNFLPQTRKYCRINFDDENYLVLRIRNTLWKVAYVFLK